MNAPMRPQDATEFMTLLHVLARKPHMSGASCELSALLCRQNCSSIIAEMVRNKANLNVRTTRMCTLTLINGRSSFGTTPLSLACHAKHTEAVEAPFIFLLSLKAF